MIPTGAMAATKARGQTAPSKARGLQTDKWHGTIGWHKGTGWICTQGETHSWSGTAAACLLLLGPFAEAPAWPLTTWGVSSHVAPKQLQLLMCVSEQQREQGARRDGLGQRCRTASTAQIPCSTQHPATGVCGASVLHFQMWVPSFLSTFRPPGLGEQPWAASVPAEEAFSGLRVKQARMTGARRGGDGAQGKCFRMLLTLIAQANEGAHAAQQLPSVSIHPWFAMCWSQLGKAATKPSRDFQDSRKAETGAVRKLQQTQSTQGTLTSKGDEQQQPEGIPNIQPWVCNTGATQMQQHSSS